MKSIVIIGASGHGKVVADIARKIGYDDILFLDDNDKIKTCNGYKIAGKCSDYINFNCDMFVAIGNAEIRKKIFSELKSNNKKIVTLIHPDAVIADGVIIGEGSVVMAGVVINPCVRTGEGCIINTCSSVDHDCVLADFVHVSVGAHLAGTVRIGECTWIGAGAVVSNNINITNNCMIGAGAVVVKDINDSGTYIGVPVKEYHPKV